MFVSKTWVRVSVRFWVLRISSLSFLFLILAFWFLGSSVMIWVCFFFIESLESFRSESLGVFTGVTKAISCWFKVV